MVRQNLWYICSVMMRFGLGLSTFRFTVWVDKEKPGSKKSLGLNSCVCVCMSFILLIVSCWLVIRYRKSDIGKEKEHNRHILVDVHPIKMDSEKKQPHSA